MFGLQGCGLWGLGVAAEWNAAVFSQTSVLRESCLALGVDYSIL